MSHIDITPNGEFDIAYARINGADLVRITLTDSEGKDSVDLTFNARHFVILANQLSNVAQKIQAKAIDFPTR